MNTFLSPDTITVPPIDDSDVNCISPRAFKYLHHSPVFEERSLPDDNTETETCCSKAYIITSTTFEIGWTCVVLVMLLLTVILVPFEASFLKGKEAIGIRVFEYFIDFFFLIDIILTFFFPYTNERTGKIIYDHKSIAKHYLQRWFVLDVVALFPYSTLKGFRLIKLLRVFRFVKFFKLVRIYRYKQKIKSIDDPLSPMYRKLDATMFRLIRVFFLLLMYAHIVACSWHAIGAMNQERSWIIFLKGEGVQIDTWAQKYTASIYWALTTMTTVGYGDIGAENTSEMLFAGFVMYSSIAILTYVWGAMSSVIDVYDEADNNDVETARKMLAVVNFAQEVRLPQKMRRDLFQRGRVATRRVEHLPTEDLIESEDERRRILPYVFEEIFENSPLITEIHKKCNSPNCWTIFATQLALKLTARTFCPGKIVCDEGSPVKDLYLVAGGKIHSSTKHTFCPGSVPGFASFVLFGFWQFDLHVTYSECQVFTITVDNFLDVLSRMESMKGCDHGVNCLAGIPSMIAQWSKKQEYVDSNKPTLQWKSVTGLRANLQMAIYSNAYKNSIDLLND